MTSRICQNLGRSRYSHCWSKKMEPLAQSTPKVLDAVPANVPATTTNSAPSSPYVSHDCRRGSRPEMIGARKMPAARKDAAVHSSDSCTCQVRARLNGRIWARSKPKKLLSSAR